MGAASNGERERMNGIQKSLIRLQKGDALLLVDVQNDFLPEGSLPAPQGAQIVAAANRYLTRFRAHGLPVFASRCWHPADHCSFQQQGGPWPVHCVQESRGAAFPANLQFPPDVTVIDKAVTPDRDAYSAFDGTSLAERLSQVRITRLFVGGLATEYCVLETVKQAIASNYAVHLLVDAIAAIDSHPGDGSLAIARMRDMGAVLTDISHLAE